MKPTPWDNHWKDIKNWKLGCIYSCKDDPRIIVPKKPTWMGRTLNFAHSGSYVVLAITLGLALSPLLVYGKIHPETWWALFLIIILGIVIFYYKVKIYQTPPGKGE